jgi:ATP-dependent DNA helicase RecQ
MEAARGARAPVAAGDAGDPVRTDRAAARRGAGIVPVSDDAATGEETELFDRLRALRKRLADERKVPAYVVFSDRTLQAMAAQRPCTADGLLEIHGVGQKKLEEYGDAFLAEISGVGSRGEPA